MVGCELSFVLEYYESRQIPYVVTTTRADRSRQIVDFTCLYVIREKIDEHGIRQVLVCGKMGREVLVDNGL